MNLKEEYIDSHRLQPATRDAIAVYYEQADREEIIAQRYWPFERVCELFFILKYADDDPRLFPHGKWATLQHIELLIQEAIGWTVADLLRTYRYPGR